MSVNLLCFLSASSPSSAANHRTCMPNCVRYSSNSYMCESFVRQRQLWGQIWSCIWVCHMVWLLCLPGHRFLFYLAFWGFYAAYTKSSAQFLIKASCTVHFPPLYLQQYAFSAHFNTAYTHCTSHFSIHFLSWYAVTFTVCCSKNA